MAKDLKQQMELGQQPEPVAKPAEGELSDEQLQHVTGGRSGDIIIRGQDITIKGSS